MSVAQPDENNLSAEALTSQVCQMALSTQSHLEKEAMHASFSFCTPPPSAFSSNCFALRTLLVTENKGLLLEGLASMC